jgi:hypothetical protein
LDQNFNLSATPSLNQEKRCKVFAAIGKNTCQVANAQGYTTVPVMVLPGYRKSLLHGPFCLLPQYPPHNAYTAARAIPPFLFVAPARHCLPAFIVLPSPPANTQ